MKAQRYNPSLERCVEFSDTDVDFEYASPIKTPSCASAFGSSQPLPGPVKTKEGMEYVSGKEKVLRQVARRRWCSCDGSCDTRRFSQIQTPRVTLLIYGVYHTMHTILLLLIVGRPAFLKTEGKSVDPFRSLLGDSACGICFTPTANVKSTLIPCPCDRSLNGDAIAERAV